MTVLATTAVVLTTLFLHGDPSWSPWVALVLATIALHAVYVIAAAWFILIGAVSELGAVGDAADNPDTRGRTVRRMSGTAWATVVTASAVVMSTTVVQLTRPEEAPAPMVVVDGSGAWASSGGLVRGDDGAASGGGGGSVPVVETAYAGVYASAPLRDVGALVSGSVAQIASDTAQSLSVAAVEMAGPTIGDLRTWALDRAGGVVDAVTGEIVKRVMASLWSAGDGKVGPEHTTPGPGQAPVLCDAIAWDVRVRLAEEYLGDDPTPADRRVVDTAAHAIRQLVCPGVQLISSTLAPGSTPTSTPSATPTPTSTPTPTPIGTVSEAPNPEPREAAPPDTADTADAAGDGTTAGVPVVYLVRTGDALWTIAAARLPGDATDAAVEAAWRAIYVANRDLIGPDPDVLRPGQPLVLP